MTATATSEPLRHTPLHALHTQAGARFVPFAGYDMPVQYAGGIMSEHLHTREACGLFDVSHMGQAFLVGPDHATSARALEALVPGEILHLKPGQQRYTQLLTPEGTIIDDLMVTRLAGDADDGRLYLVVNAARKDVDYAHIAAHLPKNVRLEPAEDRALLALQGPLAAQVMAQLGARAGAAGFMTGAADQLGQISCHISRSGYTGEDGFEISVASHDATALAELLLSVPQVRWIGLGARDSLRLEAGLCLYGHDIDETTSPIEAQLQWSISKRRRAEGGFPGTERIQRELKDGPARKLVGIKPEGRAPAREGTRILNAEGGDVGVITSGGFGPSAGGPVAMGYVESVFAAPGTPLQLVVRSSVHPAAVAALPFVPHRYVKK